jgi:hypothetical protein
MPTHLGASETNASTGAMEQQQATSATVASFVCEAEHGPPNVPREAPGKLPCNTSPLQDQRLARSASRPGHVTPQADGVRMDAIWTRPGALTEFH